MTTMSADPEQKHRMTARLFCPHSMRAVAMSKTTQPTWPHIERPGG